MAIIYNSELSKELAEGARIQVSKDIIPNQLAEKVVPVMEVNPKLLRRANIVKNAGKSTTGAGTVYSVPADKDFYLTSAVLAGTCDAAADNTSYILTVTPEEMNTATTLLIIRKQTLTAGSFIVTQTYNPPIKIKKGTNITENTSFTVGTAVIDVTITGYTTDNINA